MPRIALFLVLWFSSQGAWASSGPAELLKAFPGEVLRNEIVAFKPKADHHFSLEAPQRCSGKAPIEATARTIKCQFTDPGSAEATLNVCDDKKTFCKPVAVSLLVAEKAAREPIRLVQNQLLNKDLKASMVPGFNFATPDEARREAARIGQPVLVMISTDWCPPCNEAKEYLLTSEAFQTTTKDWYRIYVDGDSLGASEWDKVVPFHYYPSFVLLNSKMEEVARFNGELRQKNFRDWAKDQIRWLDYPIKDLRVRVAARMQKTFRQRLSDWWNGVHNSSRRYDKIRMLAHALDQRDKEMADLLIYKQDFHPEEIRSQTLNYQIEKLEGNTKPDAVKLRAALFRNLTDHNLNREDWAESVTRMCDVDEAECRALTVNIPLRLDALKTRSDLTPAERASALGEEYYYLAQLFLRLKDKAKEKEFAESCVTAYEDLRRLSKMKLPRSAQQGIVPCLEQAGRFQEAEKALKSLVEMYPYEPTFMLRMARLFRKQKKLDLALQWVNKAEVVAYGYNWFSLVLLKSEILLDLKRKDEAKATLSAALTELRLDEDRESRNQLVVSRLRAAQEKISN